MREMEAQGKQFGVEENPLRESENAKEYSFPVEREEFLFVTSPFGMRHDPIDGTKRMHTGIDIRCKGDAVLATEKGGKVVAVNGKGNTPGGKSVTVEYARQHGRPGSICISVSGRFTRTVRSGILIRRHTWPR